MVGIKLLHTAVWLFAGCIVAIPFAGAWRQFGWAAIRLTFTINSPATNLTVLSLEGTDVTWIPGQQEVSVRVPSGASVDPNLTIPHVSRTPSLVKME